MCFTCRVLMEERGCLPPFAKRACLFLCLLHTLWSLNGFWDTLLFCFASTSCCPLLFCANQRLSPVIQLRVAIRSAVMLAAASVPGLVLVACCCAPCKLCKPVQIPCVGRPGAVRPLGAERGCAADGTVVFPMSYLVLPSSVLRRVSGDGSWGMVGTRLSWKAALANLGSAAGSRSARRSLVFASCSPRKSCVWLLGDE